jgi:type II secretory pathway component PulM
MSLLDWWQQREARERYLLAGGLAFVIGLALYLALEPSINERSRMRAEIPRLQADLLWMQAHVAELKSLMLEDDEKLDNDNKNLSLASVQAVLNGLALQDAVAEMGPTANQRINLNFNDISYPDLVELMYQLRDKTGARVQSAQFSRLENKPGSVQASLILGQ